MVRPNSARSGRRFPSFLNPKYIPSNETIPRMNPNPTSVSYTHLTLPTKA